MRILGMISGTSHDGIDVAVVDFSTTGTTLTARIDLVDSVPYERDLRQRLLAALPPAPVGFDTVCRLDTEIGRAFAAAAAMALDAYADHVDAVCTHGQTVFHWIEGGAALGTLQIGQPAWIAEATGLPVVSDVRAADIAAGGQGAPLVPVLDRLLLGAETAAGRRTGALNLGGIANLTVCAPGSDPLAWDIGPANALVDAVVTADPSSDDTFDRDGALAAAGSIDRQLLDRLLAEPYYRLAPPKSSGKELFHHEYVEAALRASGTMPGLADLVATLTELTAVTVADAVRAAAVDVLVASGGGVRNPVMLGRIGELLPGVRLTTTTELGVPSDAKEAVAFALIGWATLHGLPGNVPTCTGATGPRILGRISPAPERPTPAPEPLAAWPTSLTVIGPERS